ncbi:MAG TPA: hypothetical protein VF530_01855 [Planctomycetota bacterium]
MNLLATGRRARNLGTGKGSGPRRGSSLVELLVAVAALLVGLLAFTRALTESLALGRTNRQTALATAAAQGAIERLQAADLARAFALYNEEPDDDPDGSGSAPGPRFAAAGLVALAGDGGLHGTITFPVEKGSPGVLREDLADAALRTPLDLNLDGAVDDADHSADYRLLPVRVRIAWQDGRSQRELEVATILGGR